MAAHPDGRWRELAYQYDYLGRRIHKLVQAVDSGGVGGLLMVSDDAAGKTYLALNDYIGNVCGLADPDDGSVAACYEYDPFGLPLLLVCPHFFSLPQLNSYGQSDHLRLNGIC